MTFHIGAAVRIQQPKSHHHNKLGIISDLYHGVQTKNIVYQVRLQTQTGMTKESFCFFPGEVINAHMDIPREN